MSSFISTYTISPITIIISHLSFISTYTISPITIIISHLQRGLKEPQQLHRP
jgi:hypothetical protein